ncbi:MAG: TonB-dependent receptor [Bacteroidales bacterium]|nr:TonB-dependent receptor [Candidatus Cacconaster merdequi]
MKRAALTIALAVASVMPLSAQTDLTREFHKPVIPSSVPDSLQRFDVTFDYSIFNRPYSDLYEFNPYESISLETVGPNRAPIFYAKLGAQYPFMPSGELYLQSRPKNGFCFGMHAMHDSFVGKVPDVLLEDEKIGVGNTSNSVGAGLTYDWATGEFMLDASYDYNWHSYELGESRTSHGTKAFTLSANINSAYQEDNSLYYDITCLYKNGSFSHECDSSSLLKESYLHVDGYVGASFEIHRIYVDMNIEFASYSGLKEYSSGIVEFSPIYEYDRKSFNAKLGAKFGSSFGFTSDGVVNEDVTGAQTSIFPDVDARLTLIPKSLWIHAIVTGGNDLNPFSNIVAGCPVLGPGSLFKAGKRLIDSKLSIESVISGRFGLNAVGGYVINDDKLICAPVLDDPGIKGIKTAYKDVDNIFFGAEIFWKSSDVTMGGQFRYNRFTDRTTKEVATEFPAFSGSAFFRYSFKERIIASLDVNYSGETSGSSYGEYEVPAIVDANVNVDFLLNRHMSFFLKCGNLFNQRNQYMPLYVEPGRNFGGGVCFNF